ncbi:MAG: UDP-2,4-diacetamido-2,4,6-trideoxy-beta-L-altropyranose hydrolase [Firmicutes bacterium]|nr:UDP-2,4-diacetamido-2,4,6-trideoxy-beta-L-altropyranose hydrolase [Bacillota bacterium]
MRCLTLANALKEKGQRTLFICRDFAGNIGKLIRGKGHELYYLPERQNQIVSIDRVPHASWLGTNWWQDADETVAVLRQRFGRPVDWLVVDHYAIDERWEKAMRPYTKKIMVIDDLADRPHECDLLLDQNLYEDMDRRYDNLVPPGTVKLLGPRYALLRPEFYAARQNLRQRDGTVRRILVFFGGSDVTNETLKALKAIKMLNRPDIAVDVVLGSANPHKEEITAFCRDMPQVILYCQVENMAQLMVQADLAIGAGGTATWERCCVGLPVILLAVADNQKNMVEKLGKAGAAVALGEANLVKEKDLYQIMLRLTQNTEEIKLLSERAFTLVKPVFECKKIAGIMESYLC